MVFAVRDLTHYDEFLQVREVQQQIWGFAQGEGLYPPMLKTAAENGGTIIGAFDGAKMICFLRLPGCMPTRRIKCARRPYWASCRSIVTKAWRPR
jgi:predicted GNAT superfamily acetyltransferase